MATTPFNTTAGQTIARERMIAYLNIGTSSSPNWAPLGTRVEDSAMEYDWQEETIQDILGNTYTTLKKPTITQSFDPVPLDAGEAALGQIWSLAVEEQDVQALAAQDMLIVHFYATGSFAERYSACALRVSSLGGEGGDHLEMPIAVTYGGTRTTGSATISDGSVSFTAT